MKESSNPSPQVILICQDLFFTSKVTGTAAALGISIRVVPSTLEASVHAGRETDLVLVDLSSPRSTTKANLAELRSGLPSATRLVAYGSHVEVERLREARVAGCDPVLPRSELTTQLVELLQRPANAKE